MPATSCEILHVSPKEETKQYAGPLVSTQLDRGSQLDQQVSNQSKRKFPDHKHIENLSPPPICGRSPSFAHRRRRGRSNRHRGIKEQNVQNKEKKVKPVHIASVDDYDLVNQKGSQCQCQCVKDSIEHSSFQAFPFVTYDPGLLDTAVIMITTSRTQSVHVCFKTM